MEEEEATRISREKIVSTNPFCRLFFYLFKVSLGDSFFDVKRHNVQGVPWCHLVLPWCPLGT